MRTRTKTETLYSFAELSDEAKRHALEKLSDINVDCEWWDSAYKDAARAGIEITEFDIDYRTIKGKLTVRISESIASILKDHGEVCGTYKTALHMKEMLELEDTTRRLKGEPSTDEDEVEITYLSDILNCYLQMLREEYDYQTTDEAITETIEANEYEFDEEGNLV